MEKIICGLCGYGLLPIRSSPESIFKKCPECSLIQKDTSEHIDPEGEKAHYNTHNNDPGDHRYINFLNQAVNPVLPYLKSGMQALDYGCGPGPAIDHILKSHTIACDNYDPFFRKDGIKKKAYDVIFCTECFEHFYQPIRDIAKILGLLKPGGYISVMTSLYENEDQFPNWYYARDPTHVSFFHVDTIKWIQRELNLDLVYTDEKKVMVLIKK